MNLLQLDYFISVAKHKNFTAAAKEYYISQPCISHQIKSLERELGVNLFTRSTRTVELTDEGEIFLQDAIRAVDLLKHSCYKLQQRNESVMKLKIGHLAAPTRNFLPSVVQEFKKLHPNIKINLYRQDAAQLYQSAANHAYDIYFTMFHDLMPLNGLSSKIIQTDHYCLVTPKNHPATKHLALNYEELAKEPFVFMDPARAVTMHQQVLELCKHMNFTPRIVSTYPLYEDILFAIESGIGISILPYHSKEYMNNENLTYTLLDFTNISIALALAWHKNTDNPAVALFLDTFKEYMQKHPNIFI
ncbi:LysR family transcriptional regulator [Clostridium sp. E02]|uniref:LysR family transcriptional regulator n=1 Tax=Clostridium sp. E02 TaxID=2487134 RepID=UPI000F549290|nr:LysR family transcriptional regulator [Clostridium sp. E02]